MPAAPAAGRSRWGGRAPHGRSAGPAGDAVELAQRVRTEPRHPGLFDVFLDVRNAAAAILDHTTLADVLRRDRRLRTRRGARKAVPA